MQLRFVTALIGGIFSFAGIQTQTAFGEPLPNPLTLEQALRIADETHPDIELAHARTELKQAQAEVVRAQTGLDISSQILPQYVQPANTALSGQASDSQAHIYVTKRLYDFGASRAERNAAEHIVAGSNLEFLDTRQQHHLKIMRRFFDVLLSDMRYMVDNEAMAQAYVSFDRVRQRHALGKISDVDLAKSETRYQEFLVKRTRSQIDQRLSRQQLANVLNRPTELSDRLVQPKLEGNERPVPDFEQLLENAIKSNPKILRLRAEVAAAESTLKAARKRNGPTLDAEFQASYWDRNLGLRDNWRAALNLRVPIYTGGRADADIAEMDAQFHIKQAELKKAEYDLRQHVLNLVQRLELLKVDRNTARIRSDYRDLYLDRSRALYEMEAQVSLGDAMTRMTEAQWKAARVEYDLAMTWAQIEALKGTLIPKAADVH